MKRLIFVISFVAILLLAGCSNDADAPSVDVPESSIVSDYSLQENTELSGEPKPEEENNRDEDVIDSLSKVDTFISSFNRVSPSPITDVVELTITDPDNEHYRSEFRLGAFENSIAKTGIVGEVVIDIVNCGWSLDELRIYADGITPEQAAEIVKYAAPIMDSELLDEDLQGVLDYLLGTNDYHNGYFGNLCLTFNDIHGELMLRTD